MSDDTAPSLEREVHRFFEHLDAMDLSGLSTALAEDAQGIDEISRRWMRGRAAVDAYFSQLEGAVSDPRSRISDLHAVTWGDVGLATFVLDQTYQMDGAEQKISAPTTMVFRRDGDGWKLALIHTVPLPD